MLHQLFTIHIDFDISIFQILVLYIIHLFIFGISIFEVFQIFFSNKFVSNFHEQIRYSSPIQVPMDFDLILFIKDSVKYCAHVFAVLVSILRTWKTQNINLQNFTIDMHVLLKKGFDFIWGGLWYLYTSIHIVHPCTHCTPLYGTCAVLHCCAPFIGYQKNIKISKYKKISRAACWPTRLFMRNNLFTFAPWMPLLFHHVHWDQTEESLCPSLGLGPTLAQGLSALAPLLFGTTFHYLSVQLPSENVSKQTFSTCLSPI